MDDLAGSIVAYVRRWHGIGPPNAPGERMAAQLAETIEAFARLGAAPALDAPPTDFAHTLATLRDNDLAADTATT